MEIKPNYSDIVRKYIAEIHQRDPNYFSSKTPTERINDFKIFCSQNKDGVNFKNHRALFSQFTSLQKKELNLNVTVKSTNAKSEKFTVTKGIQKANVTVNPTNTGQPQQSQLTTTTSNANQLQQSNVRPLGTMQQQTNPDGTVVMLHPIACQCNDCKIKRGETMPMDAEEAGGILEILIDFWHSRNPDVEPMTQEEVKRVGKRLAPIMERHLGGDVLLYGMAGIGIAQVLMKRVDQSRKNKPDKISDKQKKANEKTSKEKEDKSKPEPNEKPANRKFFSAKKIRDIEKLGESEE